MATDIKFVYIATGLDRKNPSVFTVRATSHVKWMVGRLNALKGKAGSPLTLPALVRFIHFDWQNNSILVCEHRFPEKGLRKPKIVWTELSAFSPKEGGPKFDPKNFITPKVGLSLIEISIVDIYRAVRKAPPGTVLDVSIYSHGFVDGPVIANTRDEQLTVKIKTKEEPIRTDSDVDGRARSDFTPHMGEPDVEANKDALKCFREGFATGATFRIFGCHVQDVVDGRVFGKDRRSYLRSTALQVIRAAYKGLSKNKKKKTALITLNMEPEFVIEDDLNNKPDHLTNFTKGQLKVLHYGLDSNFFPDKNSGELKFDKPFTEVIKFIARQTKLGYVFKAAEALPGVTCLGAVPGSGGDYEEGGHRLMFVPRKTYAGVLSFFKKFMGITLDERNYGRFDAAGVAAINDRALNG